MNGKLKFLLSPFKIVPFIFRTIHTKYGIWTSYTLDFQKAIKIWCDWFGTLKSPIGFQVITLRKGDAVKSGSISFLRVHKS